MGINLLVNKNKEFIAIRECCFDKPERGSYICFVSNKSYKVISSSTAKTKSGIKIFESIVEECG